MDDKTARKVLRLISDTQFAHAPVKDREDESTYRFHEGMYAGLQMAYDIIEEALKQKDGDGDAVD